MKNEIKIVKSETGRIKFAKTSNFSYYIFGHNTEYNKKGFEYNFGLHDNAVVYERKGTLESEYKIGEKDTISTVSLYENLDINPDIVDILMIDRKIFIVLKNVIDGSPAKNNVQFSIYMKIIPSSMYKLCPENDYEYMSSIVRLGQGIYLRDPILIHNVLEYIDMYDEDDIIPYKTYEYDVTLSLLLGPAFEKHDLYINNPIGCRNRKVYRIECDNKDYTSSLLKSFPENIPYQNYVLYASTGSDDKSYRIELSYSELLKYIAAEYSGKSGIDVYGSAAYLKIPKYKLKICKDEKIWDYPIV